MSDLQNTENPVREGTVSQKSNSQRPKSVKSSKKSATSKKSNSELKESIQIEDNNNNNSSQENVDQNGDENDEHIENPDESFQEQTPIPETPEPVEEPVVIISTVFSLSFNTKELSKFDTYNKPSKRLST